LIYVSSTHIFILHLMDLSNGAYRHASIQHIDGKSHTPVCIGAFILIGLKISRYTATPGLHTVIVTVLHHSKLPILVQNPNQTAGKW